MKKYIILFFFIILSLSAFQSTNKIMDDTLDLYVHWGILRLIDTTGSNTDTMIINPLEIYASDTLDINASNTNIIGKMLAGSLGSPIDVTNARQYLVEMYAGGNNYDVTAGRFRGILQTSDAGTKTAMGILSQASNSDGIDAYVLNGGMCEAIGKGSSAADRIDYMRGLLINTEWSALDTVGELYVLHVRTHTRDASGDGCFDGNGYGILLENEAVGGNGQALTAGIKFKGTNLSGGNFAFTDGIDMSDATYDCAEIVLRETINGEKTIIVSGSATDDAGIVTDVGADANIADGSLYLSIVDGAGSTFQKVNDVWTALGGGGGSYDSIYVKYGDVHGSDGLLGDNDTLYIDTLWRSEARVDTFNATWTYYNDGYQNGMNAFKSWQMNNEFSYIMFSWNSAGDYGLFPIHLICDSAFIDSVAMVYGWVGTPPDADTFYFVFSDSTSWGNDYPVIYFTQIDTVGASEINKDTYGEKHMFTVNKGYTMGGLTRGMRSLYIGGEYEKETGGGELRFEGIIVYWTRFTRR